MIDHNIPAVGFQGQAVVDAAEAPHTEAAVIAAVLASGEMGPDAWHKIQETGVTCDHFTHGSLKIIFNAARRVGESGAIPDAVSIATVLQQTGQLERVGGEERLAEMLQQSPIPYHISSTVNDLDEAYRRRRVLNHVKNVSDMARDPGVSIDDVEEHASSPPDFTARQRKVSGSLNEFLDTYHSMRPVLISDFLRIGEVAVVVAGSKTGKTWLSHQMVLEFLRSGQWLGKFDCYGEGKRALIIDLELHGETLAERLRLVADNLGVDLRALEGRLIPYAVRSDLGGPTGFDAVRSAMLRWKPDIVLIDSMYKAYPTERGWSENDNNAMGRFFTDLQKLAEKCGSSIVLVHHTSKGSQSGKDSIDVGSGAGSLARSVDMLLTIRRHEEQGCFTVEGNPRSCRAWPAFVARRVIGDGITEREGVQWVVDDELDPARLEGAPKSAEDKQAERKQRREQESKSTADEHDDKVVRGLEIHAPNRWIVKTELATHAGLSNANADRAIVRLLGRKELTVRAKNGKTSEYLLTRYLAEVTEAENAARAAADKKAADEDLFISTLPHTPTDCPVSGTTDGGGGVSSGQPDNASCPLSGPEKTSTKRSKRSRADKIELSGTTHNGDSVSTTPHVTPAAEGWL